MDAIVSRGSYVGDSRNWVNYGGPHVLIVHGLPRGKSARWCGIIDLADEPQREHGPPSPVVYRPMEVPERIAAHEAYVSARLAERQTRISAVAGEIMAESRELDYDSSST
jgi:hypothetical protein